MTPRPLDRLLRQISDTETEEISCSECFELLAGGVERELAGAPATGVEARLAQHLGQCAVCREEYEVLRDLVGSASRPDAGTPATPPGPAA
jgi:predicted anti-sigma-YlaC factor YlaD